VTKKPLIAGILLVVVVVATGGGLALQKFRSIAAAAGKPGFEPPEFVDVIEAETVMWQPKARLVGTVFAQRSITLANEVVGVVAEVGFVSGDEVQPGAVLLRLDATTEEADRSAAEAAERVARTSVEVAQADIRVSQSNLELAKSNQGRFQSAGGSVAASEMDRANAEFSKATADLERQRAALARSQAEVEQAQARVRQIQTIIDKKTLRSPFRARVGMRTVHPGQYLAEGSSIVGLTEVTDEVFLDFAVPQEYSARVFPGLVVVANSNVLGGEAVPITVVSIDATVNADTRNIRVRSTVADREHRLKPGMFIDVEVPIEAPRPCVAIPTTAVRRAAFGDHVFALAPGDPAKDMPGAMRAEQRMVTLGPDIGGRVIITAGLRVGDKVAASGSFKLREGALVMQAPPGGGGPGGPGAAVPGAGHGGK